MNDLEVAIPSYQRANTLAEKTLPTLIGGGVVPEKITVFVASQRQRARYQQALDQHAYGQLVVGEVGMGAQRNYMVSHYDEGTPVLFADDDLGGIYRRTGEQTTTKVTNIMGLAQTAFRLSERVGARLWGVYPVQNAFFMQDQPRTGLWYIIGAFYGMRITHADGYKVTLDDKEDFERTIRHYILDGTVLRMDPYCIQTNYYSEPGGMQEHRTEQRVTESARWLCKHFPEYCHINTSTSSEYTEVKLNHRSDRTLTEALQGTP